MPATCEVHPERQGFVCKGATGYARPAQRRILKANAAVGEPIT